MTAGLGFARRDPVGKRDQRCGQGHGRHDEVGGQGAWRVLQAHDTFARLRGAAGRVPSLFVVARCLTVTECASGAPSRGGLGLSRRARVIVDASRLATFSRVAVSWKVIETNSNLMIHGLQPVEFLERFTRRERWMCSTRASLEDLITGSPRGTHPAASLAEVVKAGSVFIRPHLSLLRLNRDRDR